MRARIVLEDEVNARFVGLDPGTLQDCKNALSYYVPGYFHMPKYKSGRWNGKIYLFRDTGWTYRNLLDQIVPIVVEAGYDITIDDRRIDYGPITDRLAPVSDDYLTGCFLRGEPLSLRDYQQAAINKAIAEGCGILEMATGSGKTLVAATISRVYSEFGRVVVIEPTIDLVIQSMATFRAVGVDPGIWYGEEKNRKQVTLATWQSLDHFPELFDGVVSFIVDEAHQAKAAVLNEMLSGPGSQVPYRFGCSGSLPPDELFRNQIKAVIGPSIFKLSSWELQKAGVLAEAVVSQIILDDKSNPTYKKSEPFDDWKSEVDWMYSDANRIEWLRKFLLDISQTGNTLVLVPFRRCGEILEGLLPNTTYLDGRDKGTYRAEVYEEFNKAHNNILIATYGIASTGIDIPRIFNMVLLDPGKQFIKILQSLGRGLRRAADKSHLNLWDIASNAKYTAKHAKERLLIYKEARQEVQTIDIGYL